MTKNKEDSKTVQDFVEAQKTAQNSVETLGQRVRQAFDNALESTREGHYVRLDKLENEADRKKFGDALASGLLDPLRDSVKALPEDPLFAEELAMHNFYGVGKPQIDGIVNGLKGNLTFENFMKNLAKPLGNAISLRQEAPVSMLNGISTAEVLKYVGVEAKRPELITLQEKAELIGYAKEQKQLDSFLKDKPYMK